MYARKVALHIFLPASTHRCPSRHCGVRRKFFLSAAMSCALAGPNGHDSPSGRNFIVVFATSETVTLTGTLDGRQWFGTVLAPWADIIVHSTIGFIDGLVVAKSYREVGNYGQIQLHGVCPTAFATDANAFAAGGATGLRCGTPICSGISDPSAPSVVHSGGCSDISSTNKCEKKARRGKCSKAGVRRKCSLTCGVCAG